MSVQDLWAIAAGLVLLGVVLPNFVALRTGKMPFFGYPVSREMSGFLTIMALAVFALCQSRAVTSAPVEAAPATTTINVYAEQAPTMDLREDQVVGRFLLGYPVSVPRMQVIRDGVVNPTHAWADIFAHRLSRDEEFIAAYTAKWHVPAPEYAALRNLIRDVLVSSAQKVTVQLPPGWTPDHGFPDQAKP